MENHPSFVINLLNAQHGIFLMSYAIEKGIPYHDSIDLYFNDYHEYPELCWDQTSQKLDQTNTKGFEDGVNCITTDQFIEFCNNYNK